MNEQNSALRWLTTAAVPAVVIALSIAGSRTAGSWHEDGQPMNLAGYLLLSASGASLVVRHRYPVAVLAAALVTAELAGSLGHAHFNWLPLIVAFFAAVRERRRAAAVASLVIGYLVAVWPPWLIGSHGHTTPTFALGLLCGLLSMLIIAELMRATVQRRLDNERMKEQEILRRASEERMRIARDLHDVVAHNIAVINVQANTALHLLDRQPESARPALTAINEVSKQALAELRAVLGVLRADGGAAPREPLPGLGRLDTLVANMAAAGLTVDLTTTGDPVALPSSVDMAAYRIIQEALTNSARHSGGARATVRVSYGDEELEIEVADEGTTGPKASRTVGTGSGIAGMTDRACALGGSLTAEPRPGRGFLVRALLPLPGSAA
jgi:signal transduction histidine kinase